MSNETHISDFKISIRRAPYFMLTGDDASFHNIKIGASIKGKSVLRGLEFDEEAKYLPDIIGVSPKDQNWSRATKDYWSDISVSVPADGTTADKLQGKIIEFKVKFKNKSDKDEFENLLDFEEKAKIISEKGEVIDGIDDYVLFRYCLVYSRVANRYADVGKSPKIRFYLYSPKTEVLLEHKKLKARVEARKHFIDILTNEKKVNAILRIFKHDLSLFETLEDKHLALELLIEENPDAFLKEVQDADLDIKAFIKMAVDKQVLYNPANTETYYYGENKEICLGHTLTDTILFIKNPSEANKEIVQAIKARTKN